MKRNVRKEFRELAERYVSLEKVAEALRPYSGFEKVSRATIYRWMQEPTRRTELAINILSSRISHSKLRVAEPKSLLVLPSLMADWEPQKSTPYGTLQKEYGVEAEKVPVDTGGEALEKLDVGIVHIALAAPELATGFPNCRRICSLSRAPILGIAKRHVSNITDLKGMRCGCFANSAIPQLLDELDRRRRLNLGPATLYDAGSMDKIVRGFDADEIDCFVAWQPYIRQIQMKRGDLIAVKEQIFGTIDIDVMVNINVGQPRAIRAYLQWLHETSEYVERRKKVEAFHAEVVTHLPSDMSLSKQDVSSVLENSSFSTADCDMQTLLALWLRSDTDGKTV